MHARNRTWLLGSDPVERCRQRMMNVEGGDGSTLSLDFTGGVLDPRLLFTRSTNATFINSQGYVEWAAANLQIYSQDQSQSGTWVRQDLSGVDANVGATTDPLGGNTASKLKSAATLQAHLVYSTVSTSINAGLAYTFSVYVKKAELKFVALHLASTARYTVVFDLDTGAMTTTNTTGSPTGTAYSSASMGNGWWRLSITMNSQASPVYPHICLSNSGTPGTNASGQPYYTGVLNDGVYTWGAQLNPGSSPLAYVATTTAQKFDTPRFDYDPTALTPRGLLIEGSANNLLKHSAYADTNWIAYGGYTKSYTTGITSPANDTTAARITFSAVGNGLYTNNTQMAYTNTVGATYTMSAWIRATSNTTNPNIRFGDSAAAAGPNIPISTSWVRYSYSYVALSASGPLIQSASGTATGEFEMWGFQLEAGSGASSYIPTGASTGSRAADYCTMPTSSFITGNPYPNTLFVDCIPMTANSGFPNLASLFDRTGGGTFSYGNQIYYYNAATMSVNRKVSASTNSDRTLATGLAYNTRHKFATSISSASFIGSRDGVTDAGATTAPSALSSAVTHFGIGCNGDSTASAVMNGWLRQIKFWPTNLPQATINSITTL